MIPKIFVTCHIKINRLGSYFIKQTNRTTNIYHADIMYILEADKSCKKDLPHRHVLRGFIWYIKYLWPVTSKSTDLAIIFIKQTNLARNIYHTDIMYLEASSQYWQMLLDFTNTFNLVNLFIYNIFSLFFQCSGALNPIMEL